MKRGHCEDRPTAQVTEYVPCAGCDKPIEKGRNQIGNNCYCDRPCWIKHMEQKYGGNNEQTAEGTQASA